ncbi:MAG: hypothetical protein II466_02700 [Bacteroidales bacterium]|nr:hypothetical protein [Bacteroidales bacterium]
MDIASGATTPSDLRILDFGARHYDPIAPRWTTPDPLAEKHFPINTYAYCAGNPVNLVDPKGMMFTERSMKYVNRVVSFSHERIAELFTAKEQLTTMLKLRKLNPRFSKLIEKVFSSIDKSIKEFRATLKEISILSDSNQLYDITTGGIIDQNGSCISDTNYEHSNNSVLISLADNNIFTIAHELKHAFQFEIGQINFTVGPYSTIDKTDEIEAYVRGEYFGGPHYEKLPSMYNHLPDGPIDFNLLGNYLIENPNELGRFIAGSQIKYAVRVNGITYSTEGKTR